MAERRGNVNEQQVKAAIETKKTKNPQDKGTSKTSREQRLAQALQKSEGSSGEVKDTKTKDMYDFIEKEKIEKKQSARSEITNNDEATLAKATPMGSIAIQKVTLKEDDEKKAEEDQPEIMSKDQIPKWFIKGSGRWRLRWDILIICFSVYNSLAIPFQFAFEPDQLEEPGIRCFDAIVDLIFLLDVVFTFRTTYIDEKTGQEVTNSRLIAKRYVGGGRFFIDILSSIPFDDLSTDDSGVLKIFGMLKLFRITRMSQVITNLNIRVDVKVFLRVIQLFFYMGLYIHVFACIWFLIVQDAEVWVLNMDFIWVGNTETYEVYFPESLTRQYLLTAYTSFYLFGVGEVVPRQNIEVIFAVFVLIISAIVNAIIIGNMAIHSEQLSIKSVEFQEKIDLTNTAMSNLGLPKGLQKEVHEYILNTHNTLDRQKELKDFMKSIQPSFRVICSTYLFSMVASQNEVFKVLISDYAKKNAKRESEEEVTKKAYKKLLGKFEIKLTVPEEEVVVQEQLEEIPYMYFVAKGRCTVFVKDKLDSGDQKKQIRILYEGEHFGEISCIYNCKRTATVISNNYCTLAKLSKDNFQELQTYFDSLSSHFKRYIATYNDDVRFFMEKEMNKVEYFRGLSVLTKQEILYSMERHYFEKGALICRKEEIATQMYLVQSGTVEIVTYDDFKRPFIIERLGRGAIINHRSFLLKDEADTDFKCSTTMSAFVLSYEAMKKIKHRRQDFKNEYMKVKKEVLASEPIALDYIFMVDSRGISEQQYLEKLHLNSLTVVLKNAIMQTWSETKQERKQPSINDLVEELLAKKREQKRKGKEFQLEEAEKALMMQKKQIRKRRRNAMAEKKQNEAKDSYLKIDQYDFIYSRITEANKKLKSQADTIDYLEKKLLEVIKKKEDKAQKAIGAK